MRLLTGFALTLALALPVAAQNPQGAGTASAASGQAQEAQKKSCLIVKHKGTLGRRLIWTGLIGVPIAPGSKYDYVEAVNFSGAKMSYKGKDLQQIQASGVHVIVLENKFSGADLETARKSCQ